MTTPNAPKAAAPAAAEAEREPMQSDWPIGRAAEMLTAYAELVKATGRYAEEHYIPEVEHVISELRLASVAALAAAPQQVAEPVASGWVSVEDARPEFVGEDDRPVWTWDGHQVREDDYGLEWDQPAGPVIGGWVVTGEGFQGDTLGRVTHWMYRNPPAPPSQASATGEV